MPCNRDDLKLNDQALLSRCDVHIYKSSGPGGQHRNKVSSAVRVRHRLTGITAHGDESRSQHQNKRMALRRLRIKIACRIRLSLNIDRVTIPPVVSECFNRPRGKTTSQTRRLKVGRKDHRFWQVGAFLLDVLNAFEGHLAKTGQYIGITTGNLVTVLKSDPDLFTAAQEIRRCFHKKPLK
jgi:hypothetical protein